MHASTASRSNAPLLAAALAATLLLGCGSTGDSSGSGATGTQLTPQERFQLRAQRNVRRATATVRGYYAALSRRDPRACTRYADAAFLRSTVGLKGKAARVACRRQLARSGLDVSLRSMQVRRLVRRDAFVEVVVGLDRSPVRRILQLRFSRGRYRIHAIAAAARPSPPTDHPKVGA